MRFILTLLLLLVIQTASLCGVQYEGLLIDKVEVIGNVPEGTFFDADLVRSHMKTRAGELYSQTAFDNDLKTLAGEYDRVEPRLEVINNSLVMTLRVWPKPMIRSITWEGNESIKTKDLQKELGISICTVFDRLAFNKAFHKLKAYYIKKSYFEAELNYDVKFDQITNEVDISITISEGRSGFISRIYFHNFCSEEEDEILDLMVTKKFNVFLSWLSGQGVYNDEMIQYDQSQIVNYLQNKGYADAQVTIEPVDSPDFCNRIHLHITADRGNLYNIGDLTFCGNKLFTNEEIENCFNIEEGGIFSPEMIRETANRIERLYGRKGYIEASASFVPKLELDSGCIYSVHFEIDEGEPYCVGMIKVFGNCTTQTNVILHETLLTPGELFNIDKLKLTEARLTNIGYFSSVNVYAVRTEETSCIPGNYRDVHIEVEEKQTGRFSTFFGYSTVESLFGGITISEKNFNAAGIPYIFSKRGPGLRGGGEFLSLNATIGQKSTSYGLSWTKPYFLDSKWSIGFDIERSSNRYISKDYDIKALGFTLRANYEINAFMRFGWHYRIFDTKVNLEHKDEVHDKELWKASHIGGLISATGISLSYDSTDRIDFPTRGYRSIFEAEFAGLGGDHTFCSFGYLNSYYYPLTAKGVIKFRADMRFIQPLWHTHFNSIPLDERLFLGGDNIMRGYRAYKLGPVFEKSHDPKGGLSQQIMTIQYNHQLFSRMVGYLFIDGGSLSDRQWHFGRFYLSAGFGAQIRVMDSFPPINLGMGFPINPKSHGQIKRFYLNFGGSF